MRQQLIAGAVALAVAGSGASAVAAQAPTPPRVGLDVTPQAITFEGAPKVGTGYHRFNLENKGRGQAGVGLMQLRPGVTAEQVSAAIGSIQDPMQIEQYGRVVASALLAPRGQYTTTVRLVDADYVVVDFTKQPAVRLSFRAGPQAGGAASVKAPSTRVTLRDYRFTMPSTLRAGRQTIRTTNAGRRMHHVLMMPLKPSADASKVLADLKAGKEPRSAIGGPPSALVEVVSKGTTNDVEVNLRRGRYLMVCFLQNSPQSKPHAQLGMRKVVTVR